MNIRTLHHGQKRLLEDTTKVEHAVMSGWGYGKSFFVPPWHFRRCVINRNSPESLVIAPDYKLLKNRCLVEYEQFLISIGMREGKHYRIYLSPSDMKIVFPWGPKPWGQTVYFLSGEASQKIISYNASHAALDEPGTMKEEVAFRVVSRIRCPYAELKQILWAGTPEGFNHFSLRFGSEECKRVEGTPFSESETKLVLHGASRDNPYLSEDFLQTLEREFASDPAYYSNYVLGIPSSLSKDRFYYNFDQQRNVGEFPPDVANRSLVVSFENNPNIMTWVALQPDAISWRVVYGNSGQGRNVQDCCREFIEAFPPDVWGEHYLSILGDASLYHPSPVSHDHGFDIIREILSPHYKYLTINAPRSNSFVHERSFTTNKLLHEGRLLIDRRCTRAIESMKAVERGPDGKPKKPNDDKITHAGEAIDHAMIVLAPQNVVRQYQGLK